MNYRQQTLHLFPFLLGLTLTMASNAAMSQSASSWMTAQQLQKHVNFLTGSALTQGNDQFQTTDGLMPVSYVSTNMRYWGEYICSTINCSVSDIVRDQPFSLLGSDLKSAGTKSQIERTNVVQGANIYDAATWQIALALAAEHGNLSKTQAKQLIDNQLARLQKIDTRGTANTFTYGDEQLVISNPQFAYAHRMLSNSFLVSAR